MFSLHLTEEAIVDYEDAVAWYESQKPGLGAEFSFRLTEVFENIEAYPTEQRYLHDNRRYAKLKQFP